MCAGAVLYQRAQSLPSRRGDHPSMVPSMGVGPFDQRQSYGGDRGEDLSAISWRACCKALPLASASFSALT